MLIANAIAADNCTVFTVDLCHTVDSWWFVEVLRSSRTLWCDANVVMHKMLIADADTWQPSNHTLRDMPLVMSVSVTGLTWLCPVSSDQPCDIPSYNHFLNSMR